MFPKTLLDCLTKILDGLGHTVKIDKLSSLYLPWRCQNIIISSIIVEVQTARVDQNYKPS